MKNKEMYINGTDGVKLNLDHFTGTENYYRHAFGGVYTDGVQHLAEKAGAYWLIDAIFSHRRKEHFQVWTLKVKPEISGEGFRKTPATLEMKEDDDAPILVRQEIEYTDFPLFEITLWLIDGVLLLPSEY